MRHKKEFIINSKDGQEFIVSGHNQKKGEKEFKLSVLSYLTERDQKDNSNYILADDFDFKIDDVIYDTDGVPYEIETTKKEIRLSRRYSSEVNWLLEVEESEDNLILMIAAKRKRDLAKAQTLAA